MAGMPENRNSSSFRHVPVMAQQMRGDGGIVDVSQAWLDALGYRVDQVIGRHFVSLLSEECAHRAIDALKTANETGHASFVPVTLIRANGGSFDMMFSLVLGAEDTTNVFGFLTDTHDNEAKIRQRDMWLRGILENAPIQIVLKDKERRLLAVSRNIAVERGVDRDSVSGMCTTDFFPPDIAKSYVEADRAVLENGETITQEVWERENGEARFVRNSKFPLRDDNGEINGVCSISMDMSELKRMEAQLAHAQKMEAVGQLTGGISHDFNNLLMVISGNAEMLGVDLGYRPPEVDAIIRAVSRGSDLTKRLLAFSRRQILQPRPVILHDLMDDVSQIIKRTMGQEISLEVDVPDCLDPVMADPNQLHNAVLNLAINARDAMTDGGTLSVKGEETYLGDVLDGERTEAEPGRYIRLSIADTGSGIEPEILGRVFEPFFTTKGEGQGSGLGLSMVYGFVKQSGGHVAIRSIAGSGTSVDLYLPIAASEAIASQDNVASQIDDMIAHGHGETVLFLEDDKEIRDMAGAMLRDLGYEAVLADGPAAALSAHKAKGDFKIVISDILLRGGLKGTDVVDLLKRAQPDLKVLFITGYAGSECTKCDLSDDSKLLYKPFSRAELAGALEELLA